MNQSSASNVKSSVNSSDSLSVETVTDDIETLRRALNQISDDLTYWVQMQNEILGMLERLVNLIPVRRSGHDEGT